MQHHGAPYRPGWGLRWAQGLQRALGAGVVPIVMMLMTVVMIMIHMVDGDDDASLPACGYFTPRGSLPTGLGAPLGSGPPKGSGLSLGVDSDADKHDEDDDDDAEHFDD